MCQGYTRFTYFRKYDRVLNMRQDVIWKGSGYSRIPNMPGFWIYAGVTQSSEYA